MDGANSLFERLKATCAEDWKRYTHHDFVAGIADGTLPEAAFRHYLIQDYLFLIKFARVYALAVYKSDTLADMRQAGAGMSAILDTEMALHVEFCRGWNLSEIEMEARRKIPPAWPIRDLSWNVVCQVICWICISPWRPASSVMLRLVPGSSDSATLIDGNPYGSWIEMYSSEDYQAVATDEVAFLDDLMARALVPAGLILADTFGKATRLEVDFWQMGLNHTGD